MFVFFHTFPYNGNPLFPCFGNCMDFCMKRKISETLNFEMFVFSHILSLLWEFTFPIFWELYESLLHPKYLRNFGMFIFSHTFPVIWQFTFPMFWEMYGFLLHPKSLRNPLIWNVCVFPYFSRVMEIHFSHVLGTAWISASSKNIQKHLTFKFSCFPIFFPFSANSLFSYPGNCMY